MFETIRDLIVPDTQKELFAAPFELWAVVELIAYLFENFDKQDLGRPVRILLLSVISLAIRW